jgi:NitT/TauT family transport system substrate-binding protein
MKRFFLLCLSFGLCFLSLEARPRAETTAPLRVGIMPDADSLPFMFARDMGFFEKEGASVELLVFSNPLERDAAIQAGRIDGAISDLLAAAFLCAGGYDFKVTSLTDGRYGIAASAQSGIKTLAELRGKRIGLSANTIIQYTVDAQLEAAGVSMSEYEAVAVPRMPLRLEMLLTGAIEAASLPEPLLTAAVFQGAVLLSSTDTSGIDAGVMLFSKKTLDTRLDSVKAFYRAYYRAALQINGDADACRDYLVEQAGFPEAVKDAYSFVHYRKPGLPGEDQIGKALAWLKARKLLDAELSPGDLTDPRAIGEW